MKTIIKSIKDFLIAEFTKEVCEKHPKAKITPWIGCTYCYYEALEQGRREERERRIEEMKEAIIRANQEIKDSYENNKDEE